MCKNILICFRFELVIPYSSGASGNRSARTRDNVESPEQAAQSQPTAGAPEGDDQVAVDTAGDQKIAVTAAAQSDRDAGDSVQSGGRRL